MNTRESNNQLFLIALVRLMLAEGQDVTEAKLVAEHGIAVRTFGSTRALHDEIERLCTEPLLERRPDGTIVFRGSSE